MVPDPVTLAVAIIVLFPMGFFLLSSPAFLLVKLDIPEVSRLLRGVFNAHFLMLSITAAIGALAFAAAGRLLVAVCIGLVAAFAAGARGWFLRRLDDQMSARDAGDADAVRRLRTLHWGGMLCNAMLLAVFVSSIPYLTPA